jgi:hypothetical protein
MRSTAGSGCCSSIRSPRDGDRAHRGGHERDAQSLVERLGVPVYTPLPDAAQDLMDM